MVKMLDIHHATVLVGEPYMVYPTNLHTYPVLCLVLYNILVFTKLPPEWNLNRLEQEAGAKINLHYADPFKATCNAPQNTN